MPQCELGILDTSTGFWLTSYNSDPALCGWGSSNAVCFDSWAVQQFNDFIAALNTWGGANRFIGQNPPPK